MPVSRNRRSSSTGSIVSLLMMVPLIAAAPASKRSPASPAASPAFFPPPPPVIFHNDVFSSLPARDSPYANGRASGSDLAADYDLYSRDLAEAREGDTLLRKRSTAAACLDSTATDVTINSLFYYGGAHTVVSLCPGANIQLNNSIYFTGVGQELSTQGYPTDSTRATLVVANQNQSCAIYGACDKCSNIAMRNIQIAGSRDTMGLITGGLALLELGGNTNGQIVDNIHAYEPRGWSVLHGIEGYQLDCNNMTITNNQIGPSGHSPTNGYQFRRRDSATYAPGQWADGISLACKGSLVEGNTITDATDGGIVIFGAPGSTIRGNTIQAQTRALMGGINAVDFGPYNGPYTGTVVEGNTIISDTAVIKVGIAIGGMVWGSDNRTADRTWGGVFQNNVLRSGSSGFFGYGIAVAGHDNATVLNNDASAASFGGSPSVSCIPHPMIPTPQAFVYDHWTTPDEFLQNNFVDVPLVFLICQQPGAIVATGPATSLNGSYIGQAPPATSSAAPSSTVSSSTVMASSSATFATLIASSTSLSSSASTSSSSSLSSSLASTSSTSSLASTSSSAAPSVSSTSSLTPLDNPKSSASQTSLAASFSLTPSIVRSTTTPATTAAPSHSTSTSTAAKTTSTLKHSTTSAYTPMGRTIKTTTLTTTRTFTFHKTTTVTYKTSKPTTTAHSTSTKMLFAATTTAPEAANVRTVTVMKTTVATTTATSTVFVQGTATGVRKPRRALGATVRTARNTKQTPQALVGVMVNPFELAAMRRPAAIRI